MDTLSLVFYGLSAVISIIVLIKFFGLCSDVSSLTVRSDHFVDFTGKFNLRVAAGLDQQALELLIEYIRNDTDLAQAVCSPAFPKTIEARQRIHEAYDKYFDALGLTLDFDRLDPLFKIKKIEQE